ncbi:type IA DNA topoisomerase [Thermosulfurimonas sp. F29]|uniref:type IA DNA topoisomerase n=1 Tax=Thermosulfurimonas sp. F29 TaxID=2867247 RepID=UPI001C829192|nr:type IA DNA topoisomerase [Thermosulfurimonas sp. F29]MBX6424096.1 hypothetical protein [Thermosulfurimonas sp. F29]
MSTLILTEKPLVAEQFAKALRAKFDRDCYRTPDGRYTITWAVGHLLEIDDAVAPQGEWSLADLPIFPAKFRYAPRGGNEKKRREAKERLEAIRKLLREADRVVIATDAGREGELIARLILHHAGWRNWDRTYRFWVSESLTPEVVRDGLASLKPASAYDDLYRSALARQHADWIVGINLTRAVTAKVREVFGVRGELFSLGRVQTAVLAVLAERELAIRNFKPEDFWTVHASFETRGHKFTLPLVGGETVLKYPEVSDRELSPEEEAEAEAEKETAERAPTKGKRFSLAPYRFKRERDAKEVVRSLPLTFTVIEARRTKVRVPPPRLFSLTELQSEANRLWGWSLKKTLDVAQSLYERHQLISYPRSDSEHLGDANRGLILGVLRKLGHPDPDGAVRRAGKHVFDDSKLTDHHAIIPNDSKEGKRLTPDEEKLYDLIVARTFAAFDEAGEDEKLTLVLEAGGYRFAASGRAEVKEGWRRWYRPYMRKPAELALPPLKEGERVLRREIKVSRGRTQPPPRFTEGSIAKSLMRNVWRYVKDARLRKVLREADGIGTPATRPEIVETLKRRNYIRVARERVHVTDRGLQVAALCQKLALSVGDIALTAVWETMLSRIAQGQGDYESFMRQIKKSVAQQVERIKKADSTFKELFESALSLSVSCPACGARLVVGAKGAFCSRECGFRLFRRVYGRDLSDREMEELIAKGRLGPKTLRSKAGRSYQGILILDKKTGRVSVEFSRKREVKKEKSFKAPKRYKKFITPYEG